MKKAFFLVFLLALVAIDAQAGSTYYNAVGGNKWSNAIEACLDSFACTVAETCTPSPTSGVVNRHQHLCGVNSHTIAMPAYTCPGTQVLNSVTHSCVNIPACTFPQVPRLDNNGCSELTPCPSGNYATVTSGDIHEGDCVPSPTDCLANKGMIVIDQNVPNSLGGQQIVKCLAAPELGCTNITGQLTANQFDYCQERKDQCTAEGGTYGAIGNPSEGTPTNPGGVTHVCLKNSGAALPTCASGSMHWYEGEVGGASSSAGFACIATVPPVATCDGQKYDCDNDGNVDDQDHDGIKDNGIANVTDTGTAPPVTGTGVNGPAGTPTPGTNVGEDKLNPPVEGAGDCDPTSTNYGDCIGKGGFGAGDSENLKKMSDALTSPGSSGPDPLTTAAPGDSTTAFWLALKDVPVVQAASNVSDMFSGSSQCPTWNVEIFDQNFTMDMHCTLYDQISGMLSAAMVAVWTLAAFRHLMSA